MGSPYLLAVSTEQLPGVSLCALRIWVCTWGSWFRTQVGSWDAHALLPHELLPRRSCSLEIAGPEHQAREASRASALRGQEGRAEGPGVSYSSDAVEFCMLLSLVSVCLLVLVLTICYLILFDSLTFSFLKRTLMVSYSAFLQTPLNGMHS